MTEAKEQSKWLCLGKSVKGASHERSGLPNQDAISWWSKKAVSPDLGEDLPLFLAVSDGHGSSKSFRSHIGSELAVKAAERVILGDKSDEVRKFLNIKPYQDTSQNSSSKIDEWKQLREIAQNILPKRIVREWKQSVKQHWTKNQVTEEEWESLIEKDGIAVKQAIEGEWERIMQQEGSPTAKTDLEDNYPAAYGVYGATLLVVLVTESFILYLQLGDGDILCVDSKGKPTRPLERDSRLIANETTSLCTPNAWREFEVNLVSYQESPLDKMPALILVATDGYANSFPSEEEFVKIGQDYREMIYSKGIGYVEQQLEGFLKETSEGGSGDDITVGVIRRVEKDDWDYQNGRITAMEEKLAHQGDTMNTQQEKFVDVDNRIKRSNTAISKVVLGLIVTFPLALIGTSLSAWLFLRLNKVDSELKNQQQRLGVIENKINQLQTSENTGNLTPSSGEKNSDTNTTTDKEN